MTDTLTKTPPATRMIWAIRNLRCETVAGGDIADGRNGLALSTRPWDWSLPW